MGRPRLLFVAGTDTDVGKTVVSAGLLRALARNGRRTVGLKPVAAGCERREHGLVNDDALALQREATDSLSYPEVNPVALEPAIAPHLAAEEVGRRLSARELVLHCQTWNERDDLDFVLIEGAGGWLVPLNATETLADVCAGLAADVVLVVGMRLGCLNHALLTVADVERRGLRLAGWVANCLPPRMEQLEGNLASLEERLSAPCLGHVPPGDPDEIVETASKHLDLGPLLEGSR